MPDSFQLDSLVILLCGPENGTPAVEDIMRNANVLLLCGTDEVRQRLVSTLANMMLQVSVAHSAKDAHELLSRNAADIALVDLESLSLFELEELVRDWGIDVICVHRLASEELWLKALHVGALDCCYPDDHRHIVEMLGRVKRTARTRTAAA